MAAPGCSIQPLVWWVARKYRLNEDDVQDVSQFVRLRLTENPPWLRAHGTAGSGAWRLAQLNQPLDRELLILLHAEPGMSYQEISKRLGMPFCSIGPRRARRCQAKLKATSAVRTFGECDVAG